MATQLAQILTFTNVPAGGQATLPHSLNVNGRAVLPDLQFRDNGGFSIVATTTAAVMVQNNTAAAATLNLYLWHLHTIIGAYGAATVTALSPQPFSPAAGSIAPGAIAAGTQTAYSGTVVFSNSNNVSFGMSGSSVITASANALTAFIDGSVTATGPGLQFNNGNGITFGIVGNTITGSVQTAGGTATGVGISAGTQIATTGAVVFSNSNGLTFGLSNQTMTASADYIRSISAGTTNASGNQLVFSNSNSVSFGASGSIITASVAFVPTVEKVVNYTATGGETDFSVTMAAVANTRYAIMAQNAGVSNMPVWDCPLGTANRALTAFRAIPSGALASGDVIQFLLFAS